MPADAVSGVTRTGQAHPFIIVFAVPWAIFVVATAAAEQLAATVRAFSHVAAEVVRPTRENPAVAAAGQRLRQRPPPDLSTVGGERVGDPGTVQRRHRAGRRQGHLLIAVRALGHARSMRNGYDTQEPEVAAPAGAGLRWGGTCTGGPRGRKATQLHRFWAADLRLAKSQRRGHAAQLATSRCRSRAWRRNDDARIGSRPRVIG